MITLDRSLAPGNEFTLAAVCHHNEMVESLIVRRWLETGAVGGAAFDLAELDAPDILRQVS